MGLHFLCKAYTYKPSICTFMSEDYYCNHKEFTEYMKSEFKAASQELSDAIFDLSGEFDKSITNDNVSKWLRLNNAQKAAREEK